MPLFRKRPVTVEARCWDDPDTTYDLVDWAGEDVLSYDETIAGPTGPRGEDWGELEVTTLEGTHIASPGDWLVRGVAGEFYFCKPEIFAATYESVEESPPAQPPTPPGRPRADSQRPAVQRQG